MYVLFNTFQTFIPPQDSSSDREFRKCFNFTSSVTGVLKHMWLHLGELGRDSQQVLVHWTVPLGTEYLSKRIIINIQEQLLNQENGAESLSATRIATLHSRTCISAPNRDEIPCKGDNVDCCADAGCLSVHPSSWVSHLHLCISQTLIQFSWTLVLTLFNLSYWDYQILVIQGLVCVCLFIHSSICHTYA